ncbi:YhdP family protein [Paralcaligenes ginsengisoli]
MAYFLLAALLLGVRYWVLPHIDQWRPYISQELSNALDAQVTLDHVAADWNGPNLSLQLRGVNFVDAQQHRLLRLPQVRAELSWRSLLHWSPQFVNIEALGLDLSVRRDRQQQIWALGYSFGLDASDNQAPDADGAAIRWLTTQRQIVLRDSTLRWIDERRDAGPLVLKHVTLKIHNQAPEHRFSLVATPPESLGASLDIRGEFEHPARTGPTPSPWSGQLYMKVGEMLPLGWKPWFDLPQNLQSGEVSAQAWLGIQHGRLDRFTSDVTVKHGRWTMGPDASVQADMARLYLAGPWGGFERIFSPPVAPNMPTDAAGPRADASAAAASPQPEPETAVQFRFETQALAVHAADVFQYPLNFERIAARGTISRQDNQAMRAAFDQVDLLNHDMDARLQGSWQEGGTGAAGVADIHGTFKRAAIAAIDQYLPNTVNLDAREWMAKGLTGGQIHDAQLLLKGDLEFFPFEDHPEQGDFDVQGRYTGGSIDYLPPEGKKLGWPQLADMVGTVRLHRADLRLTADQASMLPVKGQKISLHGLEARIPNIENNSILSIEGETVAPASAYLALMHHSPLGEMLNGDFDDAQAQDNWEVPLSLKIPLLHSRETTVHGTIRFGGGTLTLMPEMPPFKRLAGSLDFSDTEIKAENVKGEFLGGPLAASGGIGGAQKGLQIHGSLSAKALTEYGGVAGLKRLQGQIPYRAVVHRPHSKALAVTLDSTLVGLGMDFPPPLGKTSNQTLPLHLSWARDKPGGDTDLSLSLGPDISATLLHSTKIKTASYFYAGVAGVNQKPAMLPAGMNVDVQYPEIDAGLWKQIVDEFSVGLPNAGARRERPLLPDVHQLRLQAKTVHFRGLDLDQATFTARQPEPMQWRVDVSSSQTAGTMFWREAQGKVAGRINAKFDRLALGRADSGSDTDAASPDDKETAPDDTLDIPAIDLQVRAFSMYGHEFGQLSLVGVNQSRGELWRLDTLSLKGASTQLTGSGAWRLKGPQRGLTLDAVVNTTDLGAYFNQLGFKNVMSGGAGSVKGQIEWRNLPWTYEKSDLSGNLDFSLKKGRFSNINSKSARLLELLSLQSIQRLATFKFSPGSLLKDGFPYDNLRGTIKVDRGVMTTDNYRVTGPAGTIVIGGNVNLTNEKLDLQAVVVPNLDVSGAAVAAGIAINPIVGIGAFLTQWLLRGPLAKAMTVQYQVRGNWSDPQIKELAHVKIPAADEPKKSPGAK